MLQRNSNSGDRGCAQIGDELKEALARQVHLSKQRLDEITSQVYEAYKPGPKTSGKENEKEDQKAPHPLINKPTIRCLLTTVCNAA